MMENYTWVIHGGDVNQPLYFYSTGDMIDAAYALKSLGQNFFLYTADMWHEEHED